MATSEHFLLGALLAAIASFAYCMPLSHDENSQYDSNKDLTYSFHDDKVYSIEDDTSEYNREDDYHNTTDIISEEENVSGLSPDHTDVGEGAANGTSSGLDRKTADQSTDTMSSKLDASSDELYFETSIPDSTRSRSETTVVDQSLTSGLHSNIDDQSTNTINVTLNASSGVPNLVTPTPGIHAINNTFIMNVKLASKTLENGSKEALKLFCSFSEVRTMLQFGKESDCMNVREYNTSHLNQSLPVTTFTSTDKINLQEIYKSIILYRNAIQKISLLQGSFLCMKMNLTHCGCDQSMIDNIFCPSAKKDLVGHTCDIQSALKGITFDNFIYQHEELMYHLRMKPSDDSTDINPPQCTANGCDKVQIAKYTLVGIVQTIQQAEQIQKMYDALCREKCIKK